MEKKRVPFGKVPKQAPEPVAVAAAAPTPAPSTATPRFQKPKIMLIDPAPGSLEGLVSAGYNARAGTFGAPYKVNRSDERVPVRTEFQLKNLPEQEIVIVNLRTPEAVTGPTAEKMTTDGERDWWAKSSTGVIDPRPRIMEVAREYCDRILAYGGAFVIFSSHREAQDIISATKSGYSLHPEGPINADNWGLLSPLGSWHVNVKYDPGVEMQVVEPNTSVGRFLSSHKNRAKYLCTFQEGVLKKLQWRRIAVSKYGNPVAALLTAPGPPRGTVLLLPQFDDEPRACLDLMQAVLPDLSPHLFPEGPTALWKNSMEYAPLSIRTLEQSKAELVEQYEAELQGINERLDAERKNTAWQQELLIATDDALVTAVAKALIVLGFRKIVDVDAELRKEGKDSGRREDLQVMDGDPSVLVEVKGINGLPTDDDALQVAKYVGSRAKEWGHTKIHALTIINSERHIPPLARQNETLFRKELLESAEELECGLMTTWDLFKLVRGTMEFSWKHEHVRPLFLRSGRIPPTPTHYSLAGTVSHVWPKVAAFSVDLKQGSMRTGQRFAVETSSGFAEFEVASMQVDGKPVEEVSGPGEVGVKPLRFSSALRDGLRIFLVRVT